MTGYLFKQKLKIKQGYEIYCQVTGNKADDRPYVLLIPGGPGFTHVAMEELAESLTKASKKAGRQPPHFILFDPLHCGRSDKAKDFEAEFNVENYAEIAAQVVEAVQEKLNLSKMDLRLMGRSFGSMTAMSMPPCRPQWINDPDSTIRLNQLVSIVGPISHQAIEQSTTYVEQNYTYRTDFEELKFSVNKLMTGTIQNALDYQQHIACGLAPLYADKYEKLKEEWVGQMMMNHPDFTRNLLWCFSWASPSCAGMYDSLTGCSLDVLNYFFSHHFNQFNLLEKISAHKGLYQAFPICCVSGSRDYVAEPRINASLLYEQLPESLTEINFDSKHSISADHPDVYPELLELLVRGTLSEDYLERHSQGNKKAIDSYNLAHSFKQQAEAIRQLQPEVKVSKPQITKKSRFHFFGFQEPLVDVSDILTHGQEHEAKEENTFTN
ncbi:alpha/beta fold hydrolase [Legionella sp. 16cNR16C]|uniref:alpha/beta fold hydrolase n=1 Tax=Legionella sp. 16cNR16C TaxID=2905656 RepID=UPI001E2CD623|nr:alpha/beta hydrolase [Legionella sp. 16cNR16C]MCE3044182.1 alpha/beta hydrolase [Legionella sp. 16cNR16C]